MESEREERRRARLRIASVALQWYEADRAVRQAERAEDGASFERATQEAHNWLANLRDVIEDFELEGVL